jgi:regulatory protein
MLIMKIYKATDDISRNDGEKKPKKYSSFARKSSGSFGQNSRNSYADFAKKESSRSAENDEEKFVSYEDYYEKNGRDVGFGNSSFSRKKQTNLSPKEYYEKQKIRREKIQKKLADEKNFRENLANGNLENEEFIITKIAAAAKTAGRYNVFVNEKFSFSLDEIQLVNSGIKKGKILESGEYLELKNDSDFGKNYVRALDLISRRMRSEKEIRDYGFRKKWSKNATEKVVERLYARGYLDDEKFAKMFILSRANLREFSRKKIEIELMKKGISREIIAKILRENEENFTENSEGFSEDESLKKLVAKKFAKYETEQKLIAYLARQGFSYDKIKTEIREFREKLTEER